MGNTLAEYPLKFEDIPQKQHKISKARKGGKDSKMSKTTKELPVAKFRKSYSKTRGEHFKDIVITILVTAIVAFVAGSMFADKQQARIDQAVKAVTPTASAEVPVKK